MSFFYILANPLAMIIRPIYNFIGNYGLTLIIVTILIRMLTIPLTVKSQKSMAKTQLIQPELAALQKKYANDRNKLGMEMQKLYEKHGISPMGGCFPLIVQMFILFGFIGVIYNPMQYILQISKENIDLIAESVGAMKGIQDVSLCGMEGVAEKIIEMGKTPINFNFFGVDLAVMPNNAGGDLKVWIFPILAVLATIVSSLVTKKQSENKTASGNSDAQAQTQAMNNTMVWIMPVMTIVFTRTMPIGMSLYWFVSTVLQILQQTVINKIINDKVKESIKGK